MDGNVSESIVALLSGFSFNQAVFIFLLSLVSNAIPYMTVPYLVVVASISALTTDLYSKILIVVVGGLGAGIGKIIVFLLGRGFHRFLPPDSRKSLSILLRRFRKSMFLIVFLVAALPLPDDILYVPLGLAGYSLTLYATAVILGKMVITGLAVLFGASLQTISGGATLQASIAAMIIGVIVSIVVAKMKWSRVLEAYDKRGVLGAFEAMMLEALCALVALLTLNKLCSDSRESKTSSQE